MLRKVITASLFTLLCAAAGAVPFASGGPEPAKPMHSHPATHGTPKALAPIIAEARLATAKYATSLEAARKAGLHRQRHADDPGHGLALPESEDHRLRPEQATDPRL